MKHIVSVIAALFLMACSGEEKISSKLVEKGISYDLATSRKAILSDINYHLEFDIPAILKKPIKAKERIDVHIAEIKDPLILDFNEESSKIESVKVNGRSIETLHENEHITIRKKHLKKGKNVVEIVFEAGELSLNRDEEFLYTLLVPDRASTVFPCFDQPDLKATYQLRLIVPNGWKALGNGQCSNTEKKNGKTVYEFSRSDKISTYLFSFVAGKFKEVSSANTSHQKMTMLYRESDENKIEISVPDIFDLHHKSLKFMEEYTGISYPFQKLDIATIPGFQYGGMEHVGAIDYKERVLFLDDQATVSRKLGRAKLIAHETAHMWFGNLVTMKWFNDVWMKEVFANFMADKIMGPVFPQINHDLNFLTAHYSAAYNEDRTRGANPIRQYLDNLKNAGTLYGRIIYNKAPIMMRQLEKYIGEEKFQEGIQEYLQKFQNTNADWEELIQILDKKTAVDLRKWSEIWVNKSGRPIINYELDTKKGKISRLIISQKAEDGTDKLWPQQFSIGLVYPNEIKEIAVEISEKSTSIQGVENMPKPEAVIFNYNGYGYGVFPVQRSILNTINSMKDPVARMSTYLNAYENMLDGKLSPTDFIDLTQKGIKAENEELILMKLLGYLRNTYWTFLSDVQRESVHQELEAFMWKKTKQEKDSKLKKSLFNTYVGLVKSDIGVSRVYDVWRKKLEIPLLKLNENDYIGLATKLAVFGHPNQREILDLQLKAIKNQDRKKRFAFLLPALSHDEAVRDGFFESLLDPKNRSKEPWVLSGLSSLNSPVRRAYSVKYLKRSLEELEEIQLTGDIFFPKRWLENTIGRHNSPEAVQILNDFLEEHKDLSPVLKSKLLQAADPLLRAQKIIHE